jgi:hypothetical protein
VLDAAREILRVARRQQRYLRLLIASWHVVRELAVEAAQLAENGRRGERRAIGAVELRSFSRPVRW